ncbi:AAA family ATPase [Paracoccus homiensis]|uniref:AAA domain-containing protein n=1 Tax=Paracoccus homiensis TaxID=364199 RepID=A0A1I0FXE1_9RHOB|nr:AAA family ATPase [Paracoccus homiensis]SET62959.1 AAA domain-containing protein [Paracoccus homiensis]
MRFTRIEIENFKGIGVRQRIDLRPITLLFGPNSAGKSTILQALHYLREILERGNVDPDRTIAGGLIDLGGFATLVHNHELDRPVILKVVLDLSDEQGSDILPLNAGLSMGDAEFGELPVRYLIGESDDYRDYAIVQDVGLEVDIRWSALEQAAYVSRLAIELDGEPLAAIVSPPIEGRAQLTDFNFAHPLLRRAVLPDDMPEDGDEDLSMGSPLEDEIWSLAREAAADRSTPDTPDDQLRIAVGTEQGALPPLDRDLILDIRDPDVRKAELEERTPRVNGLRALLSEMILGPARLVRDHLMQMTYIGPLRDIPTRSYRPQVTPDEARWAHGLAAWDLLYNDRRGDLMDEVNAWLSGEERLRTTYRLERVEFKEIPVPSAMHQMFERGLNDDDIGELQELYLSLATRTEIALRDFEKGILVAPGDVGVGISQMVPVIVASLRKQDGVLGIEQPELHVHPAIQVGMGDLFIKAATGDEDKLTSGKTLLIETHSEHIMLRLLRRVREQTEGEVPPGVLGLTPNDLSVIYVESSVEGVRFRPLRVSPDGDFVDRWPHGFFAERAEELF